MKKQGINLKTDVKAKWKMLTSSTDLVFVLYNGMPRGGVENPISQLGEKSRGQASPDSLDRLRRAGLIEVEGGRWELSQTVFDFLESLSGTSGEANVKTIIGNLEILSKNVFYYKAAKIEDSDSGRYLAIIRKNLRTILKNIRQTLTAIDFSVRDAYMSEPSITLKIQILTENLDKLDELEAAVRGEPNKDINSGIIPFINENFDSSDDALHALSVCFQTELGHFYSRTKSRIARQLRDYLDRIEKIDKPARKIEQIFRLWGNAQLETFSNVDDYLRSQREPIQKTRDLHLSLDNDLYFDDNKNIEVVISDLNLEDGGSARVAEGVRRSEIDTHKPPVEMPYNLLAEVRTLFRKYEKAEGQPLLADFVMSYSGFSREHSFREKVGIFLETANQFRSRLVTNDEYTTFSAEGSTYKCKNLKLRVR